MESNQPLRKVEPNPPLKKVEPNQPLRKVEPNPPLRKVEPNFGFTFFEGKVERNIVIGFTFK